VNPDYSAEAACSLLGLSADRLVAEYARPGRAVRYRTAN